LEATTSQTIQKLEATTNQAIQRLEAQMGQMAKELSERKRGEFPSQTIPNPRRHEQVNAVTSLRSGKVIDNKVETEKEVEAPPTKATTSKKVIEREYVTLPPFPQRLVKPKKEKQLLDVFETLKKVEINIPLLDAIKQIPSYAKFLKDCCTNKRKFQENEQVALTVEVSAVLLRKLPPKLKDPGSFTIPCRIGDKLFDRALLDLGAGINLLPYEVYQKLSLGELQPTSITLQLADRSIKRPRGILENVLIKVDKFIVPVDFVVLNMEEAPMPSSLPIILGRSFMSTVDTNICVKKGIISMEVNGEKVEVFDAMQLPQDNHVCFNIGVVQNTAKSILQVHNIDPLEFAMTHSLTKQELEPEHERIIDIIDVIHSLEASTPHLRRYALPFETLVPTNTTFDPSIGRPPDVELKHDGYGNTKLCKEQTKKYPDKLLVKKEFYVGQKVLIYNSELRLFPNKLNSRWYGPYDVTKVYPHGAVEAYCKEKNQTFKVNGHRVKPYMEMGVKFRDEDVTLQSIQHIT
jgi:hypothetical protein